jgi:Dockerin type I domain
MRNKFICCRNRLFASAGTRFGANAANSGATLIRMVLVVSLLLCALGMTVMALTPGPNQRSTTAVPASAAALNWSVVSPPNPFQDSSYFSDVACVSDSDCWAVGRSSGFLTNAQTLIERWDGNSWVIVNSPNTSSSQTNVLNGIACASSSDCWAVGLYWNGNTQQTLIEHWDGTSWSIVDSPNTGPTFPNGFYGVTCASASDCWAVGTAITDTNTPGAGLIIEQTLIEHWDGSSWSIVTSPDTSPVESNELRSVSCASASDCWAVGNAVPAAQALAGTYQTLIEHWDGTLWTIVSSPNGSSFGSDYLNGVTCTSVSNCWAVGTQEGNELVGSRPVLHTLIERWDGTSWTIVNSPNVSVTQNNILSRVSCASASDCWAVSGYFDGSTTHMLTERWDGTSWAIVASPDRDQGQDNQLNSIACAPNSACWAVGYSADPPYDNYGARTLAQRWTGTSWSIVNSPNKTTPYNSVLSAITCTSASDCWTVGNYNTGLTNQTLTEHWDGTSWVITSSPNKTNSFSLTFDYLRGVTCASAVDCWAVGYYDTSGGEGQDFDYQTLIEHWDGNSWAIVDSSNATTARNNFLQAVTCVSASDCWAVGQYHSGDYQPAIGFTNEIYQTLIEHWNGAAWSIVNSPNTDLMQINELNSITCTASSDCWAVGEYHIPAQSTGLTDEVQTLVEHWDGNSWTIVNSPNTSSQQYNFLRGVTCTASSDCWAVGSSEVGAGDFQTLIEHWDGASWAIVASPNSSTVDVNELKSVTCVSATDCWGVGYHYNNITNATPPQTLVEHWDGISWTIVNSPNIDTADTNDLRAITCASSSDCWAVGEYFAADELSRTLALHYALPPVRLLTAASRMTHGDAGTFEVDLSLIGDPGIECRSGGANGDYTLVFTFANTLASVGGARVTSGTGSVSTRNIDGNDFYNYVVNLTGVTNAQTITVTLTNVTDSAGNFSSAVSASMGVLIGDVNASGVVTSGDTNLCKAQALQPVTNANFRCDVNASGAITTGDVNIIKQNALSHL